MHENIIVALIGLASSVLTTVLGVIGNVYLERLAHPSTGRTPINYYKWVVVGLVFFAFFVGGFLLRGVLASEETDPVIPTNEINRFGPSDFDDWNEVIAWETGYTNPTALPTGSSRQRDDGYEYDLAMDDDQVREYTVLYDKPVTGGLVTARFFLPDTGGQVEAATAGLVALQVNHPPGSPRLAESLVTLDEGEWTQVVLDLRERVDYQGMPLATGPFRLQLAFALKGSPHISAGTRVWIRVADITLYENVGDSPYTYATDGLSAFIPAYSISSDSGDFQWQSRQGNLYAQEAGSRLVLTAVGGVVGPYVEYPVHLASVRHDTWMESTQRAALSRVLRESERKLDSVIACVYVASDEASVINIIPFVILEGGVWQQGFQQSIRTNQWATVSWTGVIDSTNYWDPGYEQKLLELRADTAEQQYGFIRLVQILTGRVPLEQLGFSFSLESDRPLEEEAQFDGTIYLGNVTIFSH